MISNSLSLFTRMFKSGAVQIPQIKKSNNKGTRLHLDYQESARLILMKIIFILQKLFQILFREDKEHSWNPMTIIQHFNRSLAFLISVINPYCKQNRKLTSSSDKLYLEFKNTLSYNPLHFKRTN
jgi:hypothetical protein